ncbi:YIP1 family protein [Rheinheimera riviphila]|uniref:YIP1 family protein n=1 Tax=Rheinheimera riviphila TaxID=1834037 RepID=A0A437R1E0_9GAMM|nr:YIP1 family protein [Rheinheimera riviphila]RVU40606.1 YIP1 family protein [Rheinheimera riviphila]
MTTSAIRTSLLDIFIAPSQAFANLRGSGGNLLLLIGQMLLTALAFYLFYQGMSPEWLVEQQLLQAGDLTPAEIEQTRAVMAQTAPYTAIIAAVSGPLMLLLMNAILAGYLHLISKMSGDFRYQDWFGFSVWSQMPMQLNAIALILLVLFADSPNLPLATANYASLNQLLLQLPIGAPFYTWAEAFSLFMLWQIAVTAVGLKQWCNFSTVKAALFAALPTVLIFGIWALLV